MYKKVAEDLCKAGKAYICTYTKEQVDERRAKCAIFFLKPEPPKFCLSAAWATASLQRG